MATLEELENALRNADAAGDTVGAQVLAAEIQRMRAANDPVPEAPPGVTVHETPRAIATPEQEREFAVEQEANRQADRLKPIQALTPALQGLGLQLGDEIVGGIAGAVDAARGGNFRDSFDINRKAVNVANEREHAANPARALSTEIATSVGSGLALPILAPFRGGTAVAQAGNAATTGAAFGAGIGAAGADDGERLIGAGIGALTGAGAGGAGQAVLSTLGTLAAPILAQLRPEATTQNILRNLLRRSNQTVDDVTNKMTQASAEGQPEFMLADALGHPGQRVMSTLARSPSDARTRVVNALDDRQAGQSRRVTNQLTEAFDAPDTALQRTKALKDARRARANVAFPAAAADASPVSIKPTLDMIDEMLETLPKGQARTEVQAARDSLIGRSGRPSGDFEFLQQAKSQLRSKVRDWRNANNGQGSNDFEQSLLTRIANTVDEALEEASPSYRIANDQFREASGVIDQVNRGSVAARRGRTDDILPQFAGLSDDQKAAFRAGFADPMLAKAEATPFGSNAARPLVNASSQREFQVIAAPGKGDRLNNQLGRELTMFETRNAATGGSRTADNIADQADIPLTALQLAIRGRFVDAAESAAGRTLARFQGFTPEVSDRVSQALTTTSADATRQAFARAFVAAQRRQALEEAVSRGLIFSGVPAVGNN